MTRATPSGFWAEPPSVANAPPPPKKRWRFVHPCICRPTLAGEASRVLVDNTPIRIRIRKANKEVEQKLDVYETITATIIEAIEAGVTKFQMPWNTLASTP